MTRLEHAPSELDVYNGPGVSAETMLSVLRSTMGVCLYREGHFDEAVEYLLRSEQDSQADATRCLYLAMALYRLDQEQEARQWLKKADQVTQEGAASLAHQVYNHPVWVVRVEFDVLRREVDSLIRPAS